MLGGASVSSWVIFTQTLVLYKKLLFFRDPLLKRSPLPIAGSCIFHHLKSWFMPVQFEHSSVHPKHWNARHCLALRLHSVELLVCVIIS